MPQPADSRDRAGRFVRQVEGYSAFIPNPLPPDPPLELDAGLLGLLEEAVSELGRLDGVAKVIPDPDFFVGMYVRREAVLSSQIEGTQSTLEDLLETRVRAGRQRPAFRRATTSSTTSQAMNFGLERIKPRSPCRFA